MNRMKLNSLLTLSLLFAVGCAKDKPYDVVYKEEKLHSKSQFVTTEIVTDKDGNKKEVPVQYIYVPSSLGTPMEVAEAAPFVQGQEKVVTLKWEEAGLSVYEVERDERFDNNILNHTPVLKIPGDYLSYRCQEDAYGDCTNKEEENNELEWYEKDQFKPDFEEMKVTEVNSLDASLVDWSGCLSASEAQLVDYEVTPGVINVELQKTYTVNKSNPICTIIGAYYKSSAESSFDVRYFYSLVRVDKLASPDYQVVEYPIPDQNDYGFFKDEELVLKDDFDRQRPERKILMNRWNPIRKNNELVYYLSSEYSKPENKLILEATKEAIGVMNQEMTAANIPFTFKLVEQPDPAKAVSPGDIRYNSLVLIEDPLANGLLGYGPSVKNPYTGEILQGHVNMYLGVLKSMTRRVYEEASDLTEEEFLALQPAATPLESVFTVSSDAFPKDLPESVIRSYEQVFTPKKDETGPSSSKIKFFGRIADIEPKEVHINRIQTNAPRALKFELPLDRLNLERTQLEAQMKHKFYSETIHVASKVSIDEMIAKLKASSSANFTEVDEDNLRLKKKWNFLSENNAFSEEFFPIAGTSKVVYPELREVTGILTNKGTLKRWDDLTDTQKEKAQNIILKNSYKATLIHELGHNLGLRHNFMGSHDKDNFLSEEEATNLGLNAVPAYSSIMDYSFSEFNQLKAFGKYDIAALRFGYNREVELTNGKFMSIPGSLYEAANQLASSQAGVDPAQVVRLKNYEYCTDENTNLGNLCNRFDEGTSLVEIIKHRIKKYKDAYKYRNLRDGRIRYSTYDMPGYIAARNFELGRIRDIIEDRENSLEFWRGYLPELLAQYDVVLSPEQLDGVLNGGCTTAFGENAWFCKDYIDDGINAVNLAGEFFLDIIKTPDHMCALVKEDNPTQIVEFRKLTDIYQKIKGDVDTVPSSCFDEAVKDHVEAESLFVIGENGKFLNGFKDTDPNYIYAQDRYTRGIWPDKVFAMRNLFKRRSNFSTTDENFAAIIDSSTILEKADDLFAHLTFGRELENPKPFTTESGQTFKVPYFIGQDDMVNPLEDYFSDLAASLHMRKSGKTDLAKLMLSQIEEERTTYGDDGKYADLAFESRNLLSVEKSSYLVPADMRDPNRVYFYSSRLKTTFAAGEDSPYAFQMLSIINYFELLDQFGTDDVRKIFNAKNFIAFEIPADTEFTVGQALYWSMSKGIMEQILDLAQRGVPVEQINFAGVLGEENGAIMTEFYAQGFEALNAIYQMKVGIFEKIIAGASEDELKAFQIPSEILDAFSRGGITEDLVLFYIKQIAKLPNYAKHQDAL